MRGRSTTEYKQNGLVLAGLRTRGGVTLRCAWSGKRPLSMLLASTTCMLDNTHGTTGTQGTCTHGTKLTLGIRWNAFADLHYGCKEIDHCKDAQLASRSHRKLAAKQVASSLQESGHLTTGCVLYIVFGRAHVCIVVRYSCTIPLLSIVHTRFGISEARLRKAMSPFGFYRL